MSRLCKLESEIQALKGQLNMLRLALRQPQEYGGWGLQINELLEDKSSEEYKIVFTELLEKRAQVNGLEFQNGLLNQDLKDQVVAEASARKTIKKLDAQLSGRSNALTKCQGELDKTKCVLAATKAELILTNKQLVDAQMVEVMAGSESALQIIKDLKEKLRVKSPELANRQRALVRKTTQNTRNKEHIARLGEQIKKLHLDNNNWKAQARDYESEYAKVLELLHVSKKKQSVLANELHEFHRNATTSLTYTAPTCPHCGCLGRNCLPSASRIVTADWWTHCATCGNRVKATIKNYLPHYVQVLSIEKVPS